MDKPCFLTGEVKLKEYPSVFYRVIVHYRLGSTFKEFALWLQHVKFPVYFGHLYLIINNDTTEL